MFGMSLPEIVVVVVLALVVFGPERIPRVARTVGKIMREARKAANEVRQTLDIEDVRRDLRSRNLARYNAQAARPTPAVTEPDDKPALVTPPPEKPDAALPEIKPAAGAVAVGTVATASDAPAATDDAASSADDGADAAVDAEADRIDHQIEHDLRLWLGLPVSSPTELVALPPRATPAGRLVQRPLARRDRGRPEELSLVALAAVATAEPTAAAAA